MKINFLLPTGKKSHEYCPKCRSENIKRIFEDEKTFYLCHACGKKSPRLIIIDPKIVWWVDEKTKEYWHESVGVFVFDRAGKALFFDRILYPFGLTIPAGHLDVVEDVTAMAKRELWEETGIKTDNIKLFCEEDIVGDKCRRGADNHRWHLFVAKIGDNQKIKINDEGVKPVWLTLNEALRRKPFYAVRYLIEKYGDELDKK